jgi:hypothetical protein
MSEITYSVRVDEINPEGQIKRTFKFNEFVMGELSGSRLELDPDAEQYVGENLYLTLGPDGELIDWKGLEGIRGYTNADKGIKDNIVQMATMLFQPLNEGEKVNVGTSWDNTVEIPQKIRGGEMVFEVTTDYSVVGFGEKKGRSCVKIKTRSNFDGEGDGERAGGKKFWVAITGDGSGELWFDHEAGIPVLSSGKVTLTSDVSYELAGAEDVKTEFVTIDIEEKVELLE